MVEVLRSLRQLVHQRELQQQRNGGEQLVLHRQLVVVRDKLVVGFHGGVQHDDVGGERVLPVHGYFFPWPTLHSHYRKQFGVRA